jgi:hypothetical protein
VSELRIVVAYPDGALPGPLFQAVRRARRNFERAGYAARLDLLPASGVPDDADVVVTSDAASFAAEFDVLIERLTTTGQLVRGPVAPRTIAVHRGFRPLTERARITE